jgi:transposase
LRNTTEEQRYFFEFCVAKGVNAKEIFPVHGEECLSRKAVYHWVEKFSHGLSKFSDDVRPGRLFEIVTDAAVQQVEEFIRADRRITIGKAATARGCSVV